MTEEQQPRITPEAALAAYEQTAKTAAGAAAAKLDELEALAAPIVAWIREHHDPHTEVHISWDHAWVRQDILGVPFPYSEA